LICFHSFFFSYTTVFGLSKLYQGKIKNEEEERKKKERKKKDYADTLKNNTKLKITEILCVI